MPKGSYSGTWRHRSAYFCCVNELVPVDPAGAKVAPVSTGSADTRSAVMFTGVVGRLYPSDQEPPLATSSVVAEPMVGAADGAGVVSPAGMGSAAFTMRGSTVWTSGTNVLVEIVSVEVAGLVGLLAPVEPPDVDPPDPLPPPGNTCMAVALLDDVVMVKSPATAPLLYMYVGLMA